MDEYIIIKEKELPKALLAFAKEYYPEIDIVTFLKRHKDVMDQFISEAKKVFERRGKTNFVLPLPT